MKNAPTQSQLIKRHAQASQDGKEDPRSATNGALQPSVSMEFNSLVTIAEQLNERIGKLQDRISGVLVQEDHDTHEKDEVCAVDTTKSSLGNGLKAIGHKLSWGIARLDRIIDRVDL